MMTVLDIPDGDINMLVDDNPGQMTEETEGEKAAKPVVITRWSRRRNIT